MNRGAPPGKSLTKVGCNSVTSSASNTLMSAFNPSASTPRSVRPRTLAGPLVIFWIASPMVKVPVWRCQYDKTKVDHPASMICETCAPASPKLGKMWLDLVNRSFNSVILFWNICQLKSALPPVSRDSFKMVSTQCSPASSAMALTLRVSV